MTCMTEYSSIFAIRGSINDCEGGTEGNASRSPTIPVRYPPFSALLYGSDVAVRDDFPPQVRRTRRITLHRHTEIVLDMDVNWFAR